MHGKCLLDKLNKCDLSTANFLYLCMMHVQLDMQASSQQGPQSQVPFLSLFFPF